MPVLIHRAPYQPGYSILYSRVQGPARAAILFFHGGGWMKGDPMFCAPLWPALLAKGIACGTAELRTKARDPQATIHQCIEDAKVAADCFATMFPETPKFTCGQSTGGALAVLAATGAYRGCLLFSPELDLASNAFKNSMTRDCRDESIFPLHQAGKRVVPRTLILHGDMDETTPLATVERYAAAAQGTELVRFPDAGHAFATRPPHLERVTELVLDFIGRMSVGPAGHGITAPLD